MVIGGHAVLIYGEPRLTQDIDITLGVGTESFEELEKMMHRLSFKILVKNAKDFVKNTMVFPVKDEKSGIRVEFIFSTSAYERQAFRRVKKIQIGKSKVSFASLEDLIIHKVVASRPRDIEDVRGVLLKNPHYNSLYIKKWLDVFDQSLDQNYFESFKSIARDLK